MIPGADAVHLSESDLEAGVGFLQGNGFRVAVAGEACGEVIGGVEEPAGLLIMLFTAGLAVTSRATTRRDREPRQ